MTVQELIDKLNSLPDKNQEIFCKGLWDGIYYEIRDASLDSEVEGDSVVEVPIITIE